MSNDEKMNVGQWAYDLATELWPICRSLTGDGVRQTLSILAREMPDLKVHEVPSGEKCFDWTVPDEWTIRDAYIVDEDGNKIVDFKENNLHVVGYSESVDQWFTLDELQSRLHSLPEQPTAIPYRTSYYQQSWGFCLSHQQRQGLKAGKYHCVIDSDIKPGVLNYGEIILPGETDEEVLLSTYICHPSMANNELSGPVVTIALARWLSQLDNRRLTYRIVFVPETIGSICYLSRNLPDMKKNTIAGFVVTCVGDDRDYSYLPSRQGGTLADQAALHALKWIAPDFSHYSFLQRGSDERQYCSPGVDLPIASIMRSKYGSYAEYHTSLDDLDLISPAGLQGGFMAIRRALECLEGNRTVRAITLCEPQLGKRGLYPALNTKEVGDQVRDMMNLLAYADGNLSLLEIADTIDIPMWELTAIAKRLIDAGVLKVL